jgi:hypothetical protein
MRLPTVPAISSASIAPAVTATTTATSSASATTTAVTSAAATAASTGPASATSASFCLGPRLIHHQVASAEILAIQRIDGALRVFIVAHFHEREATRLAGETVANQIHGRGRDADLRKPFVELVFRGGKREIANVELLHLRTPFVRKRREAAERTEETGEYGRSKRVEPPRTQTVTSAVIEICRKLNASAISNDFAPAEIFAIWMRCDEQQGGESLPRVKSGSWR